MLMAPTNVGVAHNVGMKQRNILLIDDHAMVREGLRLLLTANPRLRCVIQEASTLAQGLQILNESPTIDWILLDLGLPDVDGVAALETLRASRANPRGGSHQRGGALTDACMYQCRRDGLYQQGLEQFGIDQCAAACFRRRHLAPTPASRRL